MPNDNRLRAALLALPLLLAFGPAAQAEVAQEADQEMAIFAGTVSDDMLADQRGKANIPTEVLTVMGLEGTVQENLAQNTVSGRNTITNGSFTNASGLSTAIMNSGNNVLIQNATILLLDVH